MLFYNGIVFCGGKFQKADVRTRGEIIAEVSPSLEKQEGEEAVDLLGRWLLPGFLCPLRSDFPVSDYHDHGGKLQPRHAQTDSDGYRGEV